MPSKRDKNKGQRVFSPAVVTRVIRELHAPSKEQTRNNWLRAVTSLTTAKRPEFAADLRELLEATPLANGANPLKNLSIGEIALCYEALIATIDSHKRRASGQFFTPDDTALFMAKQSRGFPNGVWLDPCCGIGNLSWHLASVQESPARFVRENLILIDSDKTALLSAVALLGTEFLSPGDHAGLKKLRSRCQVRDFLAQKELPKHDFTIANPPYARAKLRATMRTAKTREYFSYFMERIILTSSGFIAVTPSSYLNALKFSPLRTLLERENTGGNVFVFDNVPDTLFRGYKFGSSNTSSTNFVRAAVTVCSPLASSWSITPIIRWKSVHRREMFDIAASLLAPMRKGSAGEWVKLPRYLGKVWDELEQGNLRLQNLLSPKETPYSLTLATTPRYYISAAYRDLFRSSKTVLYFPDAQTRDRAALVLNSSLPYLRWRALDGGVTLPRRVLLRTPIPLEPPLTEEQHTLARELEATETETLTTKLNAGIINENVKRPPDLVARLDALVFGKELDFRLVYSEDMPALLRDKRFDPSRR